MIALVVDTYCIKMKGCDSVAFYKTNEFAQRIGVSSNTLRIWDERGWLKPHHRSPSGYRYYSDEQVEQYFTKGIQRVENNSIKGGDVDEERH